jgi:hypothetical protein
MDDRVELFEQSLFQRESGSHQIAHGSPPLSQDRTRLAHEQRHFCARLVATSCCAGNTLRIIGDKTVQAASQIAIICLLWGSGCFVATSLAKVRAANLANLTP